MVELTEESLKLIQDSLNNIADTVNEDIEQFEKDPENQQEQKDELKEENIVDKEKSSLSSQEKKRFNQIGQIFVDTWMKSIQKLQAAQEKRVALNASKKEKEPSWFKKLLDKFKPRKKEKPTEKTESSWLKKLLGIISLLGLVYVVFQDKIKGMLPMIGEGIKKLGGLLLNLCGQVISVVWDLVKELFSSVYGWLVTALVAVIGPLGDSIMSVWNAFSGWMSTAWNWIKNAFGGFINTILELPKKLLNWISEGIMSLLQPIIDAIKVAWDWLVDIFKGLFDWITGIFTNIWDTICGIFDWYIGLYKAIWNFLTGLWDNIVTFFSGLWDGVIDFIKSFFSVDLLKSVGESVGGLWNKFCNWIKEQARKTWVGRRLLGEEDEEDKERGKVDEKKPEKSISSKVETQVNKVVEQKEIKMKDNILETVKELCERLNVFFSAKSGGFIDLSKAAIDSFVSGFKDIQKSIKQVSLNNNYSVEAEVNYNDRYSWDQRDQSKRAITYDNRIRSVKNIYNAYQTLYEKKFNISTNTTSYNKTDNAYQTLYEKKFNISYNTIDLPSLNRAISIIETKTDQEVEILRSQNDYLQKMIKNMDGMSDKLEWLNSENLEKQPKNTMLPIVTRNDSQQARSGSYEASVVKGVQGIMARALGS